jgi:hypothetical protein
MWGTFRDGGLAECIADLDGARWVPAAGGCLDEAQAFAARFFPMRLLGLAMFTFVPLIVGMFWGAPAIARELEDDTVSLAWTQGVSRRRWAWTQLAFVALVAAVAMGVLTWIATWWYGPLNAATGDRFQWLIYDQQGLVPIGYAVFATLLAAFVGAVSGRTVLAMAVTTVAFVVVRFGVAVLWRPRFREGLERTYPVVAERVPNRLLGDWLYGGGGPGVGVVIRANGERARGRAAHLPRAGSRLLRRHRTRRVQPGAVPSREPLLDLPGDRDRGLPRARAGAGGSDRLVDPSAARLTSSGPLDGCR